MSVINPNPQPTYPTTQVLTRTVTVTLNPIVTASSAYASGNSVGGKLSFNNILGPQQSGVVQSLTITSKSSQTTGYKLYLFASNPGNSTITDKATPTLNAADVPSLVDVIILGNADNTLTATINVTDGISRAVVAPTSNLYGILVTTGTPTYTLASDIFISLTVMQD